MIERSGERGSGISVLAARHDDDDDCLSRIFAIGPVDLGSISGRVIPKTQKMIFDAALFNTRHYKVRIKRGVEKGTIESPATKVTNFTT